MIGDGMSNSLLQTMLLNEFLETTEIDESVKKKIILSAGEKWRISMLGASDRTQVRSIKDEISALDKTICFRNDDRF